jgi:hypothetical protein
MCMPAKLKQHENILGATHEAAMADVVIDKEVKGVFVLWHLLDSGWGLRDPRIEGA